jgi:hypothetical protein
LNLERDLFGVGGRDFQARACRCSELAGRFSGYMVHESTYAFGPRTDLVMDKMEMSERRLEWRLRLSNCDGKMETDLLLVPFKRRLSVRVFFVF